MRDYHEETATPSERWRHKHGELVDMLYWCNNNGIADNKIEDQYYRSIYGDPSPEVKQQIKDELLREYKMYLDTL